MSNLSSPEFFFLLFIDFSKNTSVDFIQKRSILVELFKSTVIVQKIFLSFSTLILIDALLKSSNPDHRKSLSG